MRLKKLTTLILLSALVLSFSGCRNNTGNSATDERNSSVGSAGSAISGSSSDLDDSEGGESVSYEESSAVENSENVSNEEGSGDMIGDITAKELIAQMKVGWNLGNTLDATDADDVTAETSWGNVKTTKETIDAVKAAGFNVLRVPVSWGTHLDENYNIDSEWMNRVQEVVDYGIDNDMIVILNTHHEEWYYPSAENLEHDTAEIEAVWTQIAEHFKSYGEKLIFEGLNEPRLRGDILEWVGNDDSRDIVNKYAETFVKTVRATGGNNANRILMVTPYAASTDEANLNAFKVPEDSGKIIVSIHAYVPQNFALDGSGPAEYSPLSTGVEKMFERIKSSFVDKGIPVVIGEFGAVNKDNVDERIKWVTKYLTIVKENGIPCIWWDNGLKEGDGENFALIDRTKNEWYFPELVDTIKKTVYE